MLPDNDRCRDRCGRPGKANNKGAAADPVG